MTDMTPEKAQALLDPFQSRSGTQAMRNLHAAAPDLARAYIAQAKQIEAADKLADKSGALVRRWETQDWVSGHTREFIDQMRAALSAYEEIKP